MLFELIAFDRCEKRRDKWRKHMQFEVPIVTVRTEEDFPKDERTREEIIRWVTGACGTFDVFIDPEETNLLIVIEDVNAPEHYDQGWRKLDQRNVRRALSQKGFTVHSVREFEGLQAEGLEQVARRLLESQGLAN